MKQLKPNLFPKLKTTHNTKTSLLLTVFLVLAVTSNATTYYFSSSLGNDSYTSAQARSQATPWKSINKLNSFFSTLVAGDSILFKRGDLFYGEIIVNKSGTPGNPIVLSVYGSGNKPVISGFTTLSSWAPVGNGVYQATASGISDAVNMVTLNNVPQHIGRYPNADAANGGFLNYETFDTTNSSITDNQLTTTFNWTGAELVIKKRTYIIENSPITNHSGSTIYYTSSNTTTPLNGYGYFIQKDVRTLDQLGEWYYNTSGKYLQMFFGSILPTSYKINVSTVNYLLTSSRYSYLTVKDLAFEGANINTFNLGALNTATTNITLKNCDVTNSGRNAIFGTNTQFTYIENCNIINSYNNAIELENEGGLSNNATIRYNDIKNSGYKVGMGNTAGESYQGILVFGNNALIEYNSIDSTGYSGIAFYYNNAKIRNNFIDHFAFVKDDGAGIYTWSGAGGSSYSGREIKNNIILNGIGAGYGTSSGINVVHGIYLDDGSEGVDIIGNSIANMGYDGIYIHNSHDLNIKNNTMYNNELQQVLFVHDNYSPNDSIKNVVFKNNILVSKKASQLCFTNRSIKNDASRTGPNDSNYYARPVDDDVVFSVTNPSINSPFGLQSWIFNFSKDFNSKKSSKKIPLYKINGLVGNNLYTNGDFASNISGVNFYSPNSNLTRIWDNSSKITGLGSLKISFPSTVNTAYGFVIKSIGAVGIGKNYILRFTTLGTTLNGSIRAYLRKTSSPYNYLVPIQLKTFGTSKLDHEFLFNLPASEAGADVVIEIKQNSGTTYIDNCQFYEANISSVNTDNEMRFEYNETSSTKTINLNANYLDIEGIQYKGSISLQPFTSKVLIKDTGSVLPSPLPILQASATPSNIICTATTYPVTVSATGGKVPYTGTGVFNTNAGKGTLKISFPTSDSTISTVLNASVGSVSTGKYYILRFSTLGTSINGKLNVFLRQFASPFNKLSVTQTKSFGTSRIDHEFMFTPTSSDLNARFDIEINQSSGTTYIDNIAFFEATTTGVLTSNNLVANGQFETDISAISFWSPNGNQLLERDTSGKIANINYYTVIDSSGVKSTVGLAIKQPAAVLTAAVSLGNVNILTVSATGGASPYTGTGIFAVKDGLNAFIVTDANGCTANTSITLPLLTSAATEAAVNCSGTSSTVTVSASGGLSPFTGTGSFITNAGKGSLKISFPTSVSTASTVIYATIGAVSIGKKYVLRFSTLGTSINGQLNVLLRQFASPFNRLSASQTKSFDTSRIDHEFTFTPTSSDLNARFDIEMNQSSGTTYIDNIAFFEAATTGELVSNNLVPNGQFETDISAILFSSSNGNQLMEWDNTSKIANINYYTVTDTYGSKSTVGLAINQSATVLIAAVLLGNSNILTVSAAGGASPYTGTGSFIAKVGVNSFIVTDANGCTANTSITIQPLSASVTEGAVNCPNTSSTVTVTTNGGLSPFTGTGSYITNAGKGSLKITFPLSISTASTVIFTSIGNITAGKNYIVRFSTLGTTNNGKLNIILRQSASPNARITTEQSKIFGTSRVDHEILFTPTISDVNGRLDIEVNQGSGTTYMDNIAFFESSPTGELISNNAITKGQFETDISAIIFWSSNGNQLMEWDNTSKIANINYYTVTDGSGIKSTVSLRIKQSATVLTAAVALGNANILTVSAAGGASPYTGTGIFTAKVGLNTFIVVDANGCTSTTSINITQLVAARVSTGSTQTVAVLSNTMNSLNKFKITCFPNPTINEFGLLVEGRNNEKVNIIVMREDGRIVFQTAGSTSNIYKFGGTFSTGIYIVKVTNGKDVRTLKVIKSFR